MATIGILTYTLPPNDIKLNKNPKIFFDTNLVNKNSNYLTTKLSGYEMLESTEFNVMNKKQKISTLHEQTSNLENIEHSPSKILKLSDIPNTIIRDVTVQPLNNILNIQKNINMAIVTPTTTVSSQAQKNNKNISSTGKKSTPLPQAVARRNARERNRVKLVNNGFAALRQHIPEEVAEAFEAAGNGRGTTKKLSKVETLRMAVEYIRSLERILGFEYSPSKFNKIDSPFQSSDDDSINTNNISLLNDDSIVIKSEQYDGSPSHSDFDNTSLYDADENSIYFANQQDNLPDVTTINGQQYLRIPGTNTYQLITAEVFENIENVPLTDNLINIGLTTNSLPSYSIIQSSSSPEQISPNIIFEQNTPALTSPPLSLSLHQPQQFDATTSNSGMQPTISPAIMEQINANENLLQLQMQQNEISQQQRHHMQQLHIKIEHDPQIILEGQLIQSSPLEQDEVQGYLATNTELQLYEGNNNCNNNISNDNTRKKTNIFKKININNNLENNPNDNNSHILENNTSALYEESMIEAINWWETTNTMKSNEESAIIFKGN